MDVSLCGPGSLLTSMFDPTATLWVVPGVRSGVNPGAETVSNFCHQVGLLYADVPDDADAGTATPTGSPRTSSDVAAISTYRIDAICRTTYVELPTLKSMLALVGDGGHGRRSHSHATISPGRPPCRRH